MSKDSELTRIIEEQIVQCLSGQAGTFLTELLRQDMDHTVTVDYHAFQAL